MRNAKASKRRGTQARMVANIRGYMPAALMGFGSGNDRRTICGIVIWQAVRCNAFCQWHAYPRRDIPLLTAELLPAKTALRRH